ncbi:hypothetical protein BGZ83_001514 [Gryganskiella cystojenkinii]|nr:hypothetical protein BGZ83_001514 [Gryganskiella cystojenkinii]
MQDQQTFLPAWNRVLDIPELCDILQEFLTPASLAACTRVSRSFYAVWTPRLWRVIKPRPLQTSPRLPYSFQKNGHHVQSLSLLYCKDSDPPLWRVRAFCPNLEELDIHFVNRRGHKPLSWQTFCTQFLGMSHDIIQGIEWEAFGKVSIPGFVPGRFHYDARLNHRVMAKDYPTYRNARLVPLKDQSTPNAFLSNILQSLRLGVLNDTLSVIMSWLARAGEEGHLKGLVQVQFDSVNTGSSIRDGDHTSIGSEVFFRFLESFPRLQSFIAEHLVLSYATFGKSEQQEKHKERAATFVLRKLRIRSLALDSKKSDDAATRKATLRILSRFPRLIDLQLFEDSVLGLMSVINYRLQMTPVLKDARTTIEFDPIRHFALKSCMETNASPPPAIIWESWRTLALSPAFCFETLDLTNREDVPGDFLDKLVSSPSILSLKQLWMNGNEPQQKAGQQRPRSLDVDEKSLREFLRSAHSLEKFRAPWTTFHSLGQFFVPEESARWPSRDQLQELEISNVNLGESDRASAQFRAWFWGFKNLEKAHILGQNMTVKVLIDPSFSTPLYPLKLKKLQMPRVIKTKARTISLDQTRYLFERAMPRLKLLEGCHFDDDAVTWLQERHPKRGDAHMELMENEPAAGPN